MAKTQRKPVDSVNVDNRLYVLKTALLIEKLATRFLATLLDAADNINGRSFSGSSALSFNQKINLLVDIDALPKNERVKFQKFMEIRNQFMHVLEADTYVKCISRINGANNYLNKNYNLKEFRNQEDALKEGVRLLSNEVYENMIVIATTAMDRGIEKLRGKYSIEAMNAFKESIEDTVPLIEAWAKRVNEGTERNVPEVIGVAFAAGIYRKVEEKMKPIFKPLLSKNVNTSASNS